MQTAAEFSNDHSRGFVRQTEFSQFLSGKRKYFEFVLILKKIKLNANVNFDVFWKKLDEKLR